MNGYCNYWLNNLIDHDTSYYLSNGTFSQIEQKMIFFVKGACLAYDQISIVG